MNKKLAKRLVGVFLSLTVILSLFTVIFASADRGPIIEDNYSVKKSTLKINEEKTLVKLKLSIDTKYGSVMEYFEIFMQRMILCRKAAEKLGLQFKLIINEQQLI